MRAKSLAGYLIITILTLALLLFYFNLKTFDLHFLLSNVYDMGDSKMAIAVFKQIISGEFGFFGAPTSNYLAAPFVFESYDFPTPMMSVWLYIKFLSIFSQNHFVVFNVFILSTFFLNAYAMYFVLQKFKINIYLSIAISVLFSFLPFHFFRFGHTLYIGYFFIPIWVYYLVLLYNKKPLFYKLDIKTGKTVFDFSKKNIAIILTLILSSTWNFYYTFFFALLLGFTTISVTLMRKSRYYLYSCIFVMAFAVVPFIISMVPYKVYEYQHGKNTAVAQRGAIDSEIFGLKITQLLFPVTYHHIQKLESFKDSYKNSAPLVNENQDATLGLVASIGFLILIFYIAIYNFKSSLLTRLSRLNIVAVIFSTVGGFGVIFAYLITSQIRGYNRISVFIAVFAFLAIAYILNYYIKKYKRYQSYIFPAVSALILAIGFYDQVPKTAILTPWAKAYDDFLSDKDFVSKIENTLPTNSMIMQWPYMSYPENGAINKMPDYAQIYGFLHSDKLKWSYGSTRGRDSDAWHKSLLDKPINEQITILEKAGFAGLIINRDGYKDNGAQIESELNKTIGGYLFGSKNNNLLFYKLTPKGNIIEIPPTFSGFYDWEGGVGNRIWSKKDANIIWRNYSGKEQVEKISFDIMSLNDRKIVIKFNKQTLKELDLKGGKPVSVVFDIVLNTGANKLEFTTDKKPEKVSDGGERELSFNLTNFKPFIADANVSKNQ